MTPYFHPIEPTALSWILLSLVLLIFAIDLVAELLNLRAMSPQIPTEFRDVFDADKYSDLLRYQSDSTRFGLIRGGIGLAATVAFWFCGGFGAVDLASRGLGYGPVATGLAFLGALAVLRGILDLPFAAWSTFVIEERHGFNRTSWRTFVTDRLKGLILRSMIGGLLAGLVLLFFESPERAGIPSWLLAWVAVSALQLLLVFVAPVWIMPLFNRYEPLPEGELKRGIEALARAEDFALSGIYRMDHSKRSSKSNAFFTGFGRHKRLVLFDTLIERATTPELVAIVAHEIGHFKLRHIQRSILLSFVVTAAVFWAIGAVLTRPGIQEGLLAAYGIAVPSVAASLLTLNLALEPAGRIWSLLTLSRSRLHEFEADAFARRVCGRGDDLIEGLRKLSRDNLSNLTPHPLKVLLDYTHPPVLERIARLRRPVSP